MLRDISFLRAGQAPCDVGELFDGACINSSPMRMRVSGERNSCEAFASSDFCDASIDFCDSSSVFCVVSSASMRSAAWLKRVAKNATSSEPCSDSRVDKSPAPQRSTPCCTVSSRLVSRRTMGYVPTATASPTRPSSHAKLNGSRCAPGAAPPPPPPAPRGRMGRGSWMYRVLPSRMAI